MSFFDKFLADVQNCFLHGQKLLLRRDNFSEKMNYFCYLFMDIDRTRLKFRLSDNKVLGTDDETEIYVSVGTFWGKIFDFEKIVFCYAFRKFSAINFASSEKKTFSWTSESASSSCT